MNGKDFWGSSIWKTIHVLAITYKPEQKQQFKKFIYSLTYLLPCELCREHLKKNLNRINIDDYLSNNHQAFLWTYILHDLVNMQLGKKSPPFEKIKLAYMNGLKMGKDFWEAALWKTIFSLAITYKPEQKSQFKIFIYSLIYLLPSKVYKKYIDSVNIDDYLSNNHQLFLWSYMIYDLINVQLGIKSLPFEKVKIAYINGLGSDCTSCKL